MTPKPAAAFWSVWIAARGQKCKGMLGRCKASLTEWRGGAKPAYRKARMAGDSRLAQGMLR
jgi:hypothetical protein